MKTMAEKEHGLTADVGAFVTTFLRGRAPCVSAPMISTAYIDAKAAVWPELPDDLRAAAYGGIIQLVRPLLRALDVVAEAVERTGNLDLPLDAPEAAYLQERYSLGTVEGEHLYWLRECLTREQKDKLVARDRKLAAHFQRRADALENWWRREHPEDEPT